MAEEDGNVGSGRSPLSGTAEWSTSAVALMQAPRPRSIDGTRPGRISSVRNVETRGTLWSESGGGRSVGEPTVRKAEPLVGQERPRSKGRRPKGNGKTITRVPLGGIGQCPIRKDADVDVVSHPKNDETTANRRES